jgi:hypothetical protein
MWNPIKLEVIDAANDSVEVLQNISQSSRFLHGMQSKRGNDLHIDIGEDSQCPQTNSSQPPHIGILRT